ncbi:hypothetical protein ACFQX9_11925 [Bradyrhizobium sp. GCM10028915]|uniref:hypothetical protein n=1 Tax=Bradyrhizobium sp. GCM10028915 TaxID=3273385 RepID=UPI003612420C
MVVQRYYLPATPYERALAPPKMAAAVKKRLRDQSRELDPVALLLEIRAIQDELGNRLIVVPDTRAACRAPPRAPRAARQ